MFETSNDLSPAVQQPVVNGAGTSGPCKPLLPSSAVVYVAQSTKREAYRYREREQALAPSFILQPDLSVRSSTVRASPIPERPATTSRTGWLDHVP